MVYDIGFTTTLCVLLKNWLFEISCIFAEKSAWQKRHNNMQESSKTLLANFLNLGRCPKSTTNFAEATLNQCGMKVHGVHG